MRYADGQWQVSEAQSGEQRIFWVPNPTLNIPNELGFEPRIASVFMFMLVIVTPSRNGGKDNPPKRQHSSVLVPVRIMRRNSKQFSFVLVSIMVSCDMNPGPRYVAVSLDSC